MLAAFIWARRVSHRQKRSGSRTRDSKARIFSLAFPVTLWKPRNPLRRMARTIFFLAPSSPRRQKRHSARRKAFGGSLGSAAQSLFRYWPLVELRWRTLPPVLPQGHRASPPFAFSRMLRTCPLSFARSKG